MLDSTRMSSSLPQRVNRSSRNVWPSALFDQVTDILADLVLEDLKQYPRIPSKRPIDSFPRQGNTSLTKQGGGE